MAVIMFQNRFADKVLSGTKLQTIRPPRKRPIVVGETLSLRQWSGAPYRSKQSVLRSAECVRVSSFAIEQTSREFVFVVDGIRLNQNQWSQLARDDGFDCTSDLLNWFRNTHGLPFRGVLIGWR